MKRGILRIEIITIRIQEEIKKCKVMITILFLCFRLTVVKFVTLTSKPIKLFVMANFVPNMQGIYLTI